jgi:hypothetical protein
MFGTIIQAYSKEKITDILMAYRIQYLSEMCGGFEGSYLLIIGKWLRE